MAFPFEAYYYSSHKNYLIQDKDKNWMQISEKSLALHLIKADFDRKIEKDKVLSGVEQMILRIQMERNVVYAGPLAGYNAGMHFQGGCNVLVTRSPVYVKSVPGTWPLINTLLNGMFKTSEIDQTPYFHLWLKVADDSFTSKTFIPGPLMAMCGPGQSGKTLVGCIITEILGSRSASPHRYMMGNSTFNSELVGSEVLIIDDEHASKDLRSRRIIGNHIKNMLFSASQSCHGKQANAFTLKPFWRMLFLINDQPENLMVLPPIDESLEDKIILFKVTLAKMPMPSTSPAEKSVFWSAIRREIPAYLHWLRNDFTFSSKSIDDRTGVVNYKHPELLAQLSELAPETRLLSLIDAVILEGREAWVGTAEELVRDLCNSEFKFETLNLLNWPNAAGTYLGRLAKSHSHRVESCRKGDSRRWKLIAA